MIIQVNATMPDGKQQIAWITEGATLSEMSPPPGCKPQQGMIALHAKEIDRATCRRLTKPGNYDCWYNPPEADQIH